MKTRAQLDKELAEALTDPTVTKAFISGQKVQVFRKKDDPAGSGTAAPGAPAEKSQKPARPNPARGHTVGTAGSAAGKTPGSEASGASPEDSGVSPVAIVAAVAVAVAAGIAAWWFTRPRQSASQP